MNVLVTGGTGFIGRHVVRRLLRNGADRIRLLVPESERGAAGEFAGIEIHSGDLSNPDALRRAAAGQKALVHLAGKNIDRDGTGFRRINVEGTAGLCDAAVACGVEKVIYLSSVGVYGHRCHREADEHTPVRPDTAFSRSKAEAEEIILGHQRAGDFQGVILRHRFVYGEGDVHVIPRMMHAARKYPFLIDRGRAKLSMILADDLAEIIRRFVQTSCHAEEFPVYHAADGFPVAYRDVIVTLCESYGFQKPRLSIPFRLLYWPVLLREKITGADPEKTHSSLSSLRLKLAGLDNTYSNKKLVKRFPDLVLRPFHQAFPGLREYYARFVEGPDAGRSFTD